MTEADADGADVPFWVIIVAVVVVCACLICGCAVFTVRCFAPENKTGPEWEVNSEGRRWVRPPNSRSPWLAYEDDRDTLANLAPTPNPARPVGPSMESKTTQFM